MKTALRIIAVGLFIGIEALYWYVSDWATTTELPPVVILLVSIGAPVLGFFAVAELWKLRDTGRRAGVVFCALTVGVVLFPVRAGDTLGTGRVVGAGVAAAVGFFLGSSPARRACTTGRGEAPATDGLAAGRSGLVADRSGTMGLAETETFELTYPRRLVQLLRLPPIFYVVAALTGVSVTFCPFYLFTLGRDGASFGDWRVIGCFVVIYGVTLVYIRLGGRVLEAIWKSRTMA